jgi:hypothetical protein
MNLQRIKKKAWRHTSPSGTDLKKRCPTLDRLNRLSAREIETTALARLEWGGDNYTEAVLEVVKEKLNEVGPHSC